VGLVCSPLLATPAGTDNPYALIGERNLFKLTDPPDPTPPPVEVPEEPPPNVKFTGYTTLMGKKRGLFKVQVPAAPPTPAKVESYILAVGAPGEGGIEVLDIDTENEKALVRIKGKSDWLPLEKDTLIAAAPAAAPAVNPAQAAAIAAAQQKMAAAQAAAGGAAPTGLPNVPQRNVRTPGTAGGVPGAAATGGLGLGQGARRQNRVFQAADQVGNISPEEQIIMIEANRLATLEEQAAGLVPPPPATELTPPEIDPTVPPQPGLEELLQGVPR